MKSVTLVLGSGGARGLSFVGCIEALLERKIRIGRIVGSSMGGVIGAMYCNGFGPTEMSRIADEFSWHRILRPIAPGSGLFSSKRVMKVIRHLIGAESFEELEVPFGVVCTDFLTGEDVLFEHGKLIYPLVGSCLAAGVFQPVFFKDRFLVDGGYSNPVPVRFCRNDPVVVAVDPNVDLVAEAASIDNKGVPRDQCPRNPYAAMVRSMDILIGHLNKFRLRGENVCLVKPDLKGFRFTDFGKADAIISSGRDATRRRIREIERLCSE